MFKKSNYLGVKNQTISEEEIKNYLFTRFNDVKKIQKIKSLVDFHSANKFMIMAHDQEKLKKLGNIVASYKQIPFSEILVNYEINLQRSLENEPTIKKHTNVILHIFGFFSKNFNQYEKKLFYELLEKYRTKNISLGKILSEIHPIIFKLNKTYLASQTYFLLYTDTQQGTLFDAISYGNSKEN